MIKRSWGKSKLFYCPKERKVWQKVAKHIDVKGYKIHLDIPTYGLERKELPRYIIVVLVIYADGFTGS